MPCVKQKEIFHVVLHSVVSTELKKKTGARKKAAEAVAASHSYGEKEQKVSASNDHEIGIKMSPVIII